MNKLLGDSWFARARSRMNDLGITQNALADALGISPGAVGHYLMGRREPTLPNFMLICQHLQVSSDWLLFGGTNKPIPLPNEEDRLARQIRFLSKSARRDIEGYIKVISGV